MRTHVPYEDGGGVIIQCLTIASKSRKQSQCVEGKSPDFPDLVRLLVWVIIDNGIVNKADLYRIETGLQLRDSP